MATFRLFGSVRISTASDFTPKELLMSMQYDFTAQETFSGRREVAAGGVETIPTTPLVSANMPVFVRAASGTGNGIVTSTTQQVTVPAGKVFVAPNEFPGNPFTLTAPAGSAMTFDIAYAKF